MRVKGENRKNSIYIYSHGSIYTYINLTSFNFVQDLKKSTSLSSNLRNIDWTRRTSSLSHGGLKLDGKSKLVYCKRKVVKYGISLAEIMKRNIHTSY